MIKLTSFTDTGDSTSAALSLETTSLLAAAAVANGDCFDQSQDAVAACLDQSQAAVAEPALESLSLNVSHDVSDDLTMACGNERRACDDVIDDVTGEGVENWRLDVDGGVSE